MSLRKANIRKNDERIDDLKGFLEKIPITIAQVRENIAELKEYEEKYNKMLKENKDKLEKIDKNKQESDKNFKELKQKINSIEDKIVKLDISYKYLEVKSNMNNSTQENSTEDDNGRALRKLNKKIIELNYNLNSESKKVRVNTCRHPFTQENL